MKNWKQKFFSELILFLLLSSITTSFLSSIYSLKPNVDLLFQSYDEKMETLYSESNYYSIFKFINKTVDENSTVLFFNWSIFVLEQPLLYPRIKADYIGFSNDQNLLQYLRINFINYIIIINQPCPLSSNTTLFSKIEFDVSIYLLKVNRSAL